MKTTKGEFTADRQTSRHGVRNKGEERKQHHSTSTRNLLTVTLFLALLIAGCSLLIAAADETEVAGKVYVDEEGEYQFIIEDDDFRTGRISKYIGSDSHITIPDKLFF